MKQEKSQDNTATLKKVNWFTILVAIVTMVLGILYIWQVNMSATRGFTMRDLENEVEEMTKGNERLYMEVARLQSVDSVSTRVQMLGLIEVSNVDYVGSDDSAVAIAR